VTEAIPSLDALVEAVLERSTHHWSTVHGEQHWRAVGVAGAELVRHVPAADPLVVFLFALFHDSMRENDGHDPEHGPRGGALARELHGVVHFESGVQLEVLVDACDRHTNGWLTADPTIGVCWDADRLNLWRVAKRPNPRCLSTEPARSQERIERAEELQYTTATWDDVFAAYPLRSPVS
jgi:uncharacterized protein